MKMKKTIIIAAALILGLVSCKKEEVKAKSSAKSYSGSATISGIIKAELDATNANLEFAPSGTVVLLEYDEKDLILDPDTAKNYATITVSTTVDANGYYSASVPTNGKTVTVAVKPQDFAYD